MFHFSDLIRSAWTGKMANFVGNFPVFMAALFPLAVPFLPFDQEFHAIRSLNLPTTRGCQEKLATTEGYQFMSISAKYNEFYRAPITKFWLNCITRCVLLILFAAFMLTGYKTDEPEILESIVAIYVFSVCLEDVIQLFKGGSTMGNTLSLIFDSMDLLALVLFFAGFAARSTKSIFNLNEGNTTQFADVFYVTCLVFSFIKLQWHMLIIPSIGPYIIILNFMLADMTAFAFILITIMLGYSVGVQALISPEENSFWDEIRVSILKPIITTQGITLFFEDINERFNCTTPGLNSNDVFRLGSIFPLFYSTFRVKKTKITTTSL